MRAIPLWIREEIEEIFLKIDRETSSPSKEEVLQIFDIDLDQIKVIILGQDPYPTLGMANGRAFAVHQDCKIPASLKNIFAEIREIQGFVNADKTLQSWIDQGVLLLNTSLTVQIGKPNSHKYLWHDFMFKLLNYLDDSLKIHWVLWGKDAEKMGRSFKNSKIIDAHPSPLSFRRRKKDTFRILNFIKW